MHRTVRCALTRDARTAGLFLFAAAVLAPEAGAFPYATMTEVTATAVDQLYESADVAWGDADNDGDLDLVACGRSDGTNRQLFMFPGNGAGGFGAAVDVNGANGGLGSCAVALGDMDADGDLDIVVTGGTAANNSQFVRVHLRGAAGWTVGYTLGGGGVSVESGGLAVGDYDNDGDLDILTTGRHYQGGADGVYLRIHQNDGAGTAYTVVAPAGTVGVWNGGAAWGDYDGDGDLDMLVSGATDEANTVEQVRVYTNNGAAAWTSIDLTPALTLGDVAWGDFNGDGRLDAAAMGSDGTAAPNGQIRWWANNGAGGFGAAQNVAAADAGFSQGLLAVGDVNRDGALDVVANGSANGTTPQVVVYINNGAGVFAANAVANGLLNGAVALADADNNGTLDLAAVGTIDGTQAGRRVRYYPSTSAANPAPNAPTVLSSTFTYAVPPAVSTAAFQWDPATDAAGGATPQNLLTYDLQISTTAAFTGASVFPSMRGATPRRGAYHRPPLVGGRHTAYLKSTSPDDAEPAHYGLRRGTTYYYRVRTIDAGLRESAWSATASLSVPPAPPGASVLAVAAATTDGQIVLNWTAPTGSTGSTYDIRWSLAAISSDALFNAATPLTGEPTPAAPGAAETMFVRGVPPEQTVFFAMKTTNTGGSSALSNSPSGTPLAFDRTQIEVGGAADAGLDNGDVAWGDMDGDGLWDIVAMGADAGGVRRLRVYRNDGAGGFVNPPLDLPFLANGNVALGDFDGDNDLDIGASGNDGTAAPNRQLRIFVNASSPGSLSFPSTVDIPGAPDQGFDFIGTPAPGGGCGLEWADMNNDGDLDVVVCGTQETTGVGQLYIYFNNGDGTFTAPQDVPTAGDNYYVWGDLAVSDFDHNGYKDIAAMGYSSTGVPPANPRRIAVYYNQGGSPLSFTEDVMAGEELSSGALAVGDANNDGWADLAFEGFNGNRQLRFCRNDNGLFDTGAFPCTDVTGAANQGLNRGEVAWGDYNNDGNLDLLAQGGDQSVNGDGGEIRLYPGNGAGGFGAVINVEVPNGGMVNEGAVGWGDFDNDGDVDLVVTGSDQYGGGGNPQLRVYVNYWSATPGGSNNPPSAPASLATDFTFSATGTSTATFKWSPATDDITPPAGLQYQIQVATTAPAYSAPLALNTPSPQYFPLIYDGNTRHGAVLTSTNPWDAQSGTLTGLITDTTYYFHVKAVDAGLLDSAWSADAYLWTGVAPGTSTISAASPAPGEASLSWLSAGDDADQGILDGVYRIQYSTDPAVAWSTSTTPAGAVTLTLSTSSAGGTAQSTTTSGLLDGTSYYFRLWSRDDVGQWSAISNQTTAYVQIATRDLVLSTGAYSFGAVGLGLSTQTTAAVTVTYAGNANATFRLYASTITPGGSPWSPAAAPGADQFRLSAGFNATQPGINAFDVTGDDVVLSTPRACTATAFALGETCLNLPAATVLSLWVRLDLPTSSSEPMAMEQQIQLTVEAGPP